MMAFVILAYYYSCKIFPFFWLNNKIHTLFIAISQPIFQPIFRIFAQLKLN